MARAGADVLAEADAIVPVPLHRAAAVDAAIQSGGGAGARDRAPRRGKPFEPRWLLRVKATRSSGRPQPRAAGRRTCRARFAPRPARRCKGRRIVLVDDVLTSGATANAAARALLRAGAADVDLIVFARVVTGA